PNRRSRRFAGRSNFVEQASPLALYLSSNAAQAGTLVLRTMSKPIASLSLDLDNKWSYLKTHGDPGWESFPSYLDLVVPRFLELLRDLDLRMTVFVVGQDAAHEKNH